MIAIAFVLGFFLGALLAGFALIYDPGGFIARLLTELEHDD